MYLFPQFRVYRSFFQRFPYTMFYYFQIRFTINRSKIEMPFLDVLIRISTNNNIITDTHMYLNFRSSHPKHIKINIPFNLASRIITITNTVTNELYYFDLRLHVLVPAVPCVSVLFPTLSVYHVLLFPPDIVDFSNTI
jgi:hypothetical protein